MELAKGADKWGKEISGTLVTFDTIDFSPNGIVGVASEGTKKRGLELLSKTVDELCNFVEYLKKTDVSQFLEKPHVE
jgi:creatinine amidohydrolase/Fe(II)-dependent formamide hydrolase-like protein